MEHCWNMILGGSLLLFVLAVVIMTNKREQYQAFPQGYRGTQYANTYDLVQTVGRKVQAEQAKRDKQEAEKQMSDAAYRQGLLKAAETTIYDSVLSQQIAAYEASLPYLKRKPEPKPEPKKQEDGKTQDGVAKESQKPKIDDKTKAKEGFRYELGLPLYIGGLK